VIQQQQLKHVHAARACFAHGGDCVKSVLLVCDVYMYQRKRTKEIEREHEWVSCMPKYES
jgi:hypothetical protein